MALLKIPLMKPAIASVFSFADRVIQENDAPGSSYLDHLLDSPQWRMGVVQAVARMG
ncbi:MAG: hypothetical protein ACRD1J_05770 [Terriglobia bacterium]